MPIFDHLAIAAEDLTAGASAIESALGVPLEPGGQHTAMSTHNRLLSLGPGEYLEVIAIDAAAPPPGRPRWFALDAFAGPARPRSWVLACDDLASALALAPPGTGTPIDFRRGDLTWAMAVPSSGLLPFDGIAPALIGWGPGVPHPSTRLPDRGVRLTALTLYHPAAPALAAALVPLTSDSRLRFEIGAPSISAEFATPHGPRVLA